MKKVGFIGWRGMVGSVLLSRMREERDFQLIEPIFFSTSQVGLQGPLEGGEVALKDAYSLDELNKMDVLLTCQGGDYTKRVHGDLRSIGWSGVWIDAASTLRMHSDSVLILDPLNKKNLEKALTEGGKDFIGANCTVSLMLMALGGLFKNGLVEWVTSMTYQAASGAGAQHMLELLEQMQFLGSIRGEGLSQQILEVDQKITQQLQSSEYPDDLFQAPLAGSLIPWVDQAMSNGQTREEWKAQAEANKLLGTHQPIPIDGTCVRVGAMRSHSQGLTLKLKKKAPLDEIEEMIGMAHDWVKLIPNTKEATLKDLSPAATSGTLAIPIGRLRKLSLGEEYLNAFTVGDQLLWGVAEPLRRMLRLILEIT